MPMMVLGLSCLVPLIKRDYKNMIQYISLTLLGFIFLGWSFMHLGLILNFDGGLYQVMYLIILTEFCDNTNLAVSRYFKGPKILSEINSRRTWLSTLFSISVTVLFAYGMRHLLPDESLDLSPQAARVGAVTAPRSGDRLCWVHCRCHGSAARR